MLLLAGCARDSKPVTDELLMGNDVVIVNAADAVRPPPYAGPDYFPAALGTPSISCPHTDAPQPVLSDFERQWYSRVLAAGGEPPLAPAGAQAHAAGARTLRFTWLGSFSEPVIVRVETSASGEARVVAKQLSGVHSSAPGGVARSVDRALTRDEHTRLEAVLARTRLFELAANDCSLGLDGAQWLFERADSGGYRFVQRWTPRKGAAWKLGHALMALTGWAMSPDY